MLSVFIYDSGITDKIVFESTNRGNGMLQMFAICFPEFNFRVHYLGFLVIVLKEVKFFSYLK